MRRRRVLGRERPLHLNIPRSLLRVQLCFREVFEAMLCDTPQLAAGSIILSSLIVMPKHWPLYLREDMVESGDDIG